MSDQAPRSLWQQLTNRDAEAAVVGYVLHMGWPHPGDALASLDAEDFSVPAFRVMWDTATELWRHGTPPRVEAVVARLTQDGRLAEVGGAAALIDLASDAVSVWQMWADVVARDADARRLAVVANEVREQLSSPTRDPQAIAADMIRAVQMIGSRAGAPPPELAYVDDVLDAPDDTHASEWLIPRMIRRGWRVVLTGAEGLGKMVLLRQLAWSVSQGCYPFAAGQTIPRPLVTMLVDLENPRDAIQDTGRQIRAAARAQVGALYDPQRQTILERPGGMDLRSRKDRVDLESAIASQRPDIVVIGPLYKTFRRERHETDEQAAQAAQQVLDDLRTRHGFALIIEAHSSKGGPGSVRSLEVTGSSAWMRWPEIGIGIRKAKVRDGAPPAVTIERWRGDRVHSRWPTRLERSTPWPWEGVWAAGAWKDTPPDDGQEEIF